MMFMPLLDFVLFCVILVLGIVLARLAWLLRKAGKSSEKKPSNGLVLGLSVLAIAMSLILIGREVQGMAAHKYDPKLDQALGRTLAVLFIPDKPEGEVVVISQGLPEEGSVYEDRIAKVRLEAFLEQMAAAGYPKPNLISPVQVMKEISLGQSGKEDEVIVDEYWMMDGELPTAVLTHVWKRYPNATVVVSLVGAPRRELRDLSAEKPKGSAFYALDLYDYEPDNPNLDGTPLDGVVVYHPRPDWEVKSGDDETLFSSRYVFVTR